MTGLYEDRRAAQSRSQWPMRGGRGYQAAKRILDVVVSLILIVVVSPLLAGLWLMVRWSSPGPGLFRQERLGEQMRRFPMLKLRTMYADTSDQVHREYVASLASGDQAAASGPRGLYKLEADPRITPHGAWLRRTSLDELPQLFNVLKGEMTLVGPRPALPWEAELWPSAHPEYSYRFDVKPGITGLWQVSGRGSLTAEESVRLDAEYVRRRSFLLDLAILARTLPALLRGSTA
jgi:lipopolysaccharide/colanic/teichoic acid biosynthesis glycosyltransferase